MVLDTNENLIYITLDELISFSYPSGSLVKTKDFYEKPRSASSIAEEISEQNEKYMLSHVFSAAFNRGGYTYVISLAPDLCEVTNTECNVINVRVSGGQACASDNLINKWKCECAISAAICARATSSDKLTAKLLYFFDRRLPPQEHLCADSITESENILYSTIDRAFRLISIHKATLCIRFFSRVKIKASYFARLPPESERRCRHFSQR